MVRNWLDITAKYEIDGEEKLACSDGNITPAGWIGYVTRVTARDQGRTLV